MAEVRRLGYSGKVPSHYYKDRETLWVNHGASNADFYDFMPRLKAGKPVLDILARNTKQIEPAFQALQVAFKSTADQANVPLVNVARNILVPATAPVMADAIVMPPAARLPAAAGNRPISRPAGGSEPGKAMRAFKSRMSSQSTRR